MMETGTKRVDEEWMEGISSKDNGWKGWVAKILDGGDG